MGVSLHTFGLPADHLGPLARTAEETGFDMVWVSEHLISPVAATTPHPRDGDARSVVPPTMRLLDPWLVIVHMAAATSVLRFGTSIALAPLRHPIEIARTVGSAQFLTGGRVVAGFGVGWLAEEYAAVGADFDHRGRNMDEILEVLTRLWSGGTVTNDGPAYPFAAVDFGPVPAPIPVVLGGTSPPALRRAARFADGWILTGRSTLDELIRIRTEIERLRAIAGRLEVPFTYYVSLPSAERSLLGRYRDAGFDHVTLNAYAHWRSVGADLALADRLDAIRAMAAELGLEPGAGAELQQD
jgi:probable F420-dependent oxidoreductase